MQRAVQAVLLCMVTMVMLGAGESRFDRLGHEMICMCGCNQILLDCNHVGCPVSPVMIGELQSQLASGASDSAIFAWFTNKYGPTVLAAPTHSGFDEVAWIMPLAVFLLATLGAGLVVWAWRQRSLRLAAAAHGFGLDPGGVADDPQTEAMRERIRRETEYR